MQQNWLWLTFAAVRNDAFAESSEDQVTQQRFQCASLAPCAWVLADAVYGSDYKTRHMLEERQQPYVLSVRSNQTLRLPTKEGLLPTDPPDMAEDLPNAAWQALPMGEGAKGLRLYDLARISLPYAVAPGFARYVLIRKSRSNPDAVSYYLVFAPAEATPCRDGGCGGSALDN